MTQIIHAAAAGRFSEVDLQRALDILDKGGCVGLPTDTVYGLGVLPHLEESIARLYEIKKRAPSKAIAILVARPQAADEIAGKVSEYARKWMDAFWPGALTLVFPLKAGLPDVLSGNRTIGVRMPDHTGALQLLQRSGPLAVTSANLSGAASAISAAEVLAQLDGQFDLLLDAGVTPGGHSSTVVDCTGSNYRILREGPISEAQLLRVLRGEA